MAVSKAKEFLNFLFLESQEEQDVELFEKENDNDDSKELANPEIRLKNTEKKKTELAKILTELGVKDVKERLQIDGETFKLVSNTPEEHQFDSAILFDLTKINPLIEANFVAIDGETQADGSTSIVLIHGNQNGEVPENAEVEEALVLAVGDITKIKIDPNDKAKSLIEKLLGENLA